MDYDFVSCLDDPGEKLPALEGFLLFAIIMYDKFSSKLILKVKLKSFSSFFDYLFIFLSLFIYLSNFQHKKIQLMLRFT